MAALTKEAILAAIDIKWEVVEVPEWGGDVRVKEMSGQDRDAYEVSLATTNKDRPGTANLDNIRARLAAYTIVDEAGVRLFSEADIAALGQKSCSALDRVFAVACRLNGIGKTELEALSGN